MRSSQGLGMWLGNSALVALIGLLSLQSSCAGPRDCERNSDCVNAYCDDGECKKDCIVAEVDCPRGWTCNVIAKCEPPLDGGVVDPDAGETGSGGTSGAGGTGGTGGGPAGSGGGTGGMSGTGGTAGIGGTAGTGGTAGAGGSTTGGVEFDYCGSDADCSAPLACRAMNVGGTVKRCTRLCSMSSQCMTGTRCTYDTGFCAFDDDGKPCNGTGQCGDACAALGYCSSECNTALDCPGGWGCVGASTGGKACVRLDQLCDASNYSACLSQAHCDNETMLVGGCTIQCTTVNDCPQRALGLPTWYCNQGVCIRPDDVWGAVPKGDTTQWACEPYNNTVVNLCADALTFDAAPALTCPVSVSVPTSGGCVQSCRYSGGCGYGWGCVGLGEMAGQRVGICIRAGAGEVGQGCANNEDCLFSLCDNGTCSRDCTVDGVCPTGFSCIAGGSPNVEGMQYRICK